MSPQIRPARPSIALFTCLALLWWATGCDDDNPRLDHNQHGADVSTTDDTGGSPPNDTDEMPTSDTGGITPPGVEIDDAQIDILWMIDNSGSMCRSQEIVRNGIDEFADMLAEKSIDFHIGITTTHMFDCDEMDPEDSQYSVGCEFEPVARAGRLQSTPQPIPGFDPTCYHPLYLPDHPDVQNGQASPGEPNPEHLDPLVENIEQAIECTTNPADWEHLINFDEKQLRCALPTQPNVEDCPSDNPDLEEFFPPEQAYRDIPVVLRSQDYTDETGLLDLESFRNDFACASLVGTRGYGFERGLDAVVTALSPELTGGAEATIEDQDQYPNAGFVRPRSRTGVIFVSDENDCSHDGELNEQTVCGVHKCTIEEARGDEGHLTPVEDLYGDFMQNLRASKDAAVPADSVFPASIHGYYREPTDVPEQCPAGDPWRVDSSCRTEMGRAWSGHRYEEFLRHFPAHFPHADESNPDRPLDGLICDDFSPALYDIARFFRSE